MPRKSRNQVYYHTDELRKFHNKTVPLRFNHDDTPTGIIGTATFSFDEEKEQVNYEATITDSNYQKLIDTMNFQVSIGATASEPDHKLCDDTERECLNAPVLGSIDELSIVETPGIPESTINIVETTTSGTTFTNSFGLGTSTIPLTFYPHFQHEVLPCGCIKKDCNENFHIKTSDKPNIVKEESMVQETPQPTIKVEETKPVETPTQIETPTPKVEESVKAETPVNSIDSKKIEKDITESAEKQISEVVRELRETWIPKSEVNESLHVTGFEKPFTAEEAQQILEKLDDQGYVKLKIDKEDFIKAHTRIATKDGRLTEAITTSGTIPGIQTDNEVVVLLDGKTALSVRGWGQFRAIPTGQNTERFYKITIPDAAAITESPTTDITQSTHTLTSVDVTCSIRGWRQNIKRSQFEDFPAAFLNAIRESARIEAIRDEHRLILQTITGTSFALGGSTATAPKAFHIDGTTGGAVTTPTLEGAAVELDEDGVSFAKRYLQQGHDPTIGPNDLVMFLAPRAFESLYTAANLLNYTQFGNPSVTRLGVLEQVYGVDLVITNELLVANNAYRNVVVRKGKAWALCSQRDMNIQLQDIIKGQTTDVVWTHRIGVGQLDNKAYCIVSSQQD